MAARGRPHQPAQPPSGSDWRRPITSDALTIEQAFFDHAIPPLPLNDSRAFGDRWLTEQRSIVLTVPSAVSPYDRNLLIKPAHPDCGRISCSEPAPVLWDQRLFREVE